jgi:hypothetical protein
MPSSIYQRRGDNVYATELARGPWDPNAQHGGAAAAIVMRALEQVDDGGLDLQFARVTYELLKPVPLGELTVRASLLRPGRRVQLLEAELATPEGATVLRARALRAARAPVTAGVARPAPPPPEQGAEAALPPWRDHIGFPGHGMEVRFLTGDFATPGPAIAWFRLRHRLIDGELPSPLQRLAAAADFPNGISTELPWREWLFINPDLTLYIEREPVGEWICLDAQMHVQEGGVGQTHARLYDRRGPVGRALQSLYIAPR